MRLLFVHDRFGAMAGAEVNLQLSIPLQEWVAALNLPFTAVALIGLALLDKRLDRRAEGDTESGKPPV